MRYSRVLQGHRMGVRVSFLHYEVFTVANGCTVPGVTIGSSGVQKN